MKATTKRTLIDIAVIIISGFIFSCGLKTFTAPNDIAPGGASGICVAVAHLTGLSEGVLYFIVNVPLIVIGFIFLGRRLMFKTLLSIIIITVATDYVFAYLPHYEGDEMLAAIFGGLLIGAGLGLCYSREGTGGGTDILNRLIYKRFPQISIGAITFATDFAVIVFATCVFGKIESALYAIIAIFCFFQNDRYYRIRKLRGQDAAYIQRQIRRDCSEDNDRRQRRYIPQRKRRIQR